MKPVAFDYKRPVSVAEALAMLTDDPDAKIIAGGQTLAPLLNFRLLRPNAVIDITRIAELSRVTLEADGITIGACVTHAAIEDARFSDPTRGFLTEVAHGIAYRAIRTRGTIGGSLAHADPAADWLSVCLALSAEVVIANASGPRRLPLSNFVLGAMTTVLAHNEILTGVRIGKISRGCRTGFAKLCRKTGEFAEAIAAFVDDRDRDRSVVVLGGVALPKPVVIETQEVGQSDRVPTTAIVSQCLSNQGFTQGSYVMNILTAAVERAFKDARRP
jgi:aerobic carbon-monoxide dehydrogenase medium subunit